MANKDITLKRKTASGTDTLNPTTTWSQVNDKPTTFAPTAHTHDVDDINASGTPSSTTYLRGDGAWVSLGSSSGLNFEGTIDLSTAKNGDDLASAGLGSPGDYLIVSATGDITNAGSTLVTLSVQTPGDEGDSNLPVTLEQGDWIVYESASGTTVNVAIINNEDGRLSNYVAKSGDTMTGDLVFEKEVPAITLNMATDVAGNGGRIIFADAGATQDVQLRFNHYDSERPPFGLVVERGPNNTQTTSNAYLQVQGEIYANSTQRVFADDYHPNADKLTTARNIALTGAVTGNADFDGSGNISIATTNTADPVITLTGAVTGSGTMTNLGNVSIATTATADPTLTLSGDATGSATFTNLGNATLSVTVVNDSHTHDGRYYTETEADGRFVNVSGDTMTGTLAYTALDGPTTQTRDKVRVWSGGTYTIGMKSGYTYGGLNNDYAMSFQMNDDSSRGFWWGDSAHSDAQGAMSLTTNGNLVVANSILVGEGEGYTSAASDKLDVRNGYIGLDRGQFIRWNSAPGSGTGEYIYSKASSPYDVTIHSGSYDALQAPNTGEVIINYQGAQKFVTTSSGVQITGNADVNGRVYASSGIDIESDQIYVDNQHGFSNSGAWTRNQTPHGYIDFGPANTSYAHIYTDRPSFYFNKELYMLGNQVYHNGYHPEADRWTTARTLSLTGDVTGSVSWSGSANASITTTVGDDSHKHNASSLDIPGLWTFRYSTTTTMSDPGDGWFRLNNTTQTSATQAVFDDVDYYGRPFDIAGAELNDGAIISLYAVDSIGANWDGDELVRYYVNLVADGSGYTLMYLKLIEASADAIDANDTVYVRVTPAPKASSTVAGGLKARLNGTTLYLRNDSSDA